MLLCSPGVYLPDIHCVCRSLAVSRTCISLNEAPGHARTMQRLPLSSCHVAPGDDGLQACLLLHAAQLLHYSFAGNSIIYHSYNIRSVFRCFQYLKDPRALRIVSFWRVQGLTHNPWKPNHEHLRRLRVTGIYTCSYRHGGRFPGGAGRYGPQHGCGGEGRD